MLLLIYNSNSRGIKGENMSLEWFFQLPGLFITGGIVLILIALLVFIISSKGEKKADDNLESAANETEVPNQPIGEINSIGNIGTSEPVKLDSIIPQVEVNPAPVEPAPVEVNVVTPEPVTPQVEINPVPVEPAPVEVNVATPEPVVPQVEVTPAPEEPAPMEINPVPVENTEEEKTSTNVEEI